MHGHHKRGAVVTSQYIWCTKFIQVSGTKWNLTFSRLNYFLYIIFFWCVILFSEFYNSNSDSTASSNEYIHLLVAPLALPFTQNNSCWIRDKWCCAVALDLWKPPMSLKIPFETFVTLWYLKININWKWQSLRCFNSFRDSKWRWLKEGWNISICNNPAVLWWPSRG